MIPVPAAPVKNTNTAAEGKGTAKDAIVQINAKYYAVPCKVSGQKIVLIGSAFNKKTRKNKGLDGL